MNEPPVDPYRRPAPDFKSFVDQAPDFIARFDRELRCVYANRGLEAMGFSPDDLLSSDLHELPLAPTHGERVEGALRRAIEQGESSSLDCVLQLPAGVTLYFEVRVVPDSGADGHRTGAFAIFRDTTAARFRENRHRYRASLLEAVGEAVAAVDFEGRVVYWNRQAEALHGWRSEEVLGWHALKLLVPYRELREVARALRPVGEGEPWSGELKLKRSDGTTIPVFVTVSPVRDENARVAGFVSTWTDLTDRNHLAEQLRHAQKMEAVGRLAGGIAHDFNNLLTAINGYTELTLNSLDASAPEQAYVEEIRAAAERAGRLTRQLLSFSRKQIFQPRIIDPRRVILEMEKLLRPLIGEDLEFHLSIEEETATVLADPTQIEQVVLNLVLNARDAMPLGGALTVSVRDRFIHEPLEAKPERLEPGRYVLIAVEDTGSGILPEVQPHVFDPFYTTKPQGMGTGLGLSTVYGIVQQSGGAIVLESDPASGTTFSVYLPATGEAPVRSPARRSRPRAPVGEREGTVLLAEDDASLRRLATRLLERMGFEVIPAEDGVEALEICRARSEPFDLVLTDVVMPKKGGIELALEILNEYPHVPVLFMSGYLDQLPDDQSVLEPGRNLLQKPFTLGQLAECVDAVLEARTRR